MSENPDSSQKNQSESVLWQTEGLCPYLWLRTEKIRTVTAFRTPLPPYILLSTSVLAEGVDLHTECRHIVHYDHEWNPAKLEQKTGRVDRVGSKAERLSQQIDIQLPYIKHTQDEKAFRVVMARKSWFDTVMGENYEAKWDVEKVDEESVWSLPERIKEELRMKLDNEAHSENRPQSPLKIK